MRRLLYLAVLVLAVVLALAPFGGAAQPKPHFWLTVLHNNDGESQLLNAPGQPDYGGIARFKTLVDRLKLEATEGVEAEGRPGKDGVVMLSSGDNFLAGPQFQASLTKGVPYYDSIGLSLVGYDAMALGNHEFDFGQEPALQALVDQGRVAKSTVVKERGELIGIVGATTPLLSAISSPRRV